MSQERRDKKADEHVCKWVGCTAPQWPTLASLVTHVSDEHLAQMAPNSSAVPVRYSCQWEGCSRFFVEQPSRFALISHCRTHTGEKPYFCPIPECEKHFTRSDALAKHVKGVHDLHQHRDALALMRFRSEKGKSDLSPVIDVHALTDDDYSACVARDYALRVPWWFSESFANVLTGNDNGDKNDKNDINDIGTTTLQQIYNQPLEMRPHDVATLRYKRFLEAHDDDELISGYDVSVNPDLAPAQANTRNLLSAYQQSPKPVLGKHASLEQKHDALQATLATANRINKIVKAELDTATSEKRRLWVATQALLDANIKLGLGAGTAGVTPDIVDEVLLTDGMEETAHAE